MNVTAPNASIAGGSAIAILVSGGSLDMSNGSIASGDAKAGTDGTTLADDSLLDGDAGDPGVGICGSGVNNKGLVGKTTSCMASTNSTAGNGGDGGEFTMSLPQPAASGTDGNPPDGAQATDGKGGLGEGQGTPVALVCKDGTGGVPGSVGDSGAGASGSGAVSVKDLYQGTPGKDGSTGKPGQGGGGGGGAKGAIAINCGMGAADRVGAGGTGGCGGAMGGGGKPGGSSMALVVLNATVKLADVTLTAGKGGKGGKGGDGQSGGQKGPGGNPGPGKGAGNPSCRGGDGGKG